MTAILIGLLPGTPTVSAIELFRSETTEAITVVQPFEGWIIDSIEIDNRDIYDLNDERYQGFLFRTANRLHIVTRERIIRQELLFAVGDSLSPILLDETARNLRLRFPLNDAWIELEELSVGHLLVRVVTIDQWSLIGGLRSVNRDGGETDLRLGLEERNLIGRAQFLSFDFYARNQDPNYIQIIYREPRVFGRPWSIGLHYRSDPQNSLKSADISHPFYSLAQSYAFEMGVAKQNRLVERFNETGDVVSEWTRAGEVVTVGAAFRAGPSHRKTTMSADYRYVYQEIIGLSEFGVDSVYHRFSLGVTNVWQEFITEKRIRGFGYTEDFALGLSLGGRYGRAFRPGLRGYLYDHAEGEAGGRWKLGHNLVGVDYHRTFWFKGDREIRRRYGVALTLYNNRWRHLTWAFRSRYQLDRDGQNLNLLLGGKNGLRGYPSEFRAGDRSHVVNIESRLFFGLEILSVKIGSALFIDLGRTWQPEETLAFRDYHLSGGFGLRMSLENLLKGEIIRMDVALTEGGHWDLSVGTGQYF